MKIEIDSNELYDRLSQVSEEMMAHGVAAMATMHNPLYRARETYLAMLDQAFRNLLAHCEHEETTAAEICDVLRQTLEDQPR